MQICYNKRALHDYQVLEEYEAGIVLSGDEIKAVRARRVSIAGSYVKPMKQNDNVELFWIGAAFTLQSGVSQRTRKILLHKTEVNRLLGKLSTSNLTVIPLELYLLRGIAKLKIGLSLRKKIQDKREVLKKRAIESELRASVKKKLRSTE